MTKHNDRKTNARNLSRMLNINYTTGLRLAETSQAALEAKIIWFPYDSLRPAGVWGIANPDPAFPQSVRNTPWDWHPEDGFTRGGAAHTPSISSGSKIMSEMGMRADAAFILGTGIRSHGDLHIIPYKHPAGAFLEHLPSAHTKFDPQLFAELGFAARGTSWILKDDAAHTMVVREMATLMAALLMDAGARSRVDGEAMIRVAGTIRAQLVATEHLTEDSNGKYNAEGEVDEDVKWVDDLYEHSFGVANSRISNVGYSASAILLDLRKCGNVTPQYYASPKRIGHFMSAVGPQRTRQFLEGMTDLFSALYLLGESKKQAA